MPTNSNEPLFPHVGVRLVGADGNAFAIIARVRKALRRAGEHDAAEEFVKLAMEQESYGALLRLVLATVNEDDSRWDE